MSHVPNLARFFIQGGGEVPAEVQSELYDIRFLCANHAAFAALRQDGQVPSETSGKFVAFDGWVLLWWKVPWRCLLGRDKGITCVC